MGQKTGKIFPPWSQTILLVKSDPTRAGLLIWRGSKRTEL